MRLRRVVRFCVLLAAACEVVAGIDDRASGAPGTSTAGTTAGGTTAAGTSGVGAAGSDASGGGAGALAGSAGSAAAGGSQSGGNAGAEDASGANAGAGPNDAQGGAGGTAGTAGVSGGMAGAAGAGADGAAPLCPDGPYGAESFYFGAAVVDTALNSDPDLSYCPTSGTDLGHGYVSPDGLRFIQSLGGHSGACCGGCGRFAERVRASPLDDWVGAPFASYLQSFWGGQRLVLDNLGLFACHGGVRKCAYYERSTVSQAFPYGYPADPDHTQFDDAAPFDGTAADQEFTPTPDARLIAFTSNRASATDDTAVGDDTAQDLWMATALDVTAPFDPKLSYGNLVKLDGPSSPDAADFPHWISQDAGTIVFQSRFSGSPSFDLYVTSRVGDAGSTFSAAQRIVAVSSDGADEDSFSMPSVATLQASGNRGFAYFRRAVIANNHVFYRVPVCLGSASGDPCGAPKAPLASSP